LSLENLHHLDAMNASMNYEPNSLLLSYFLLTSEQMRGL